MVIFHGTIFVHLIVLFIISLKHYEKDTSALFFPFFLTIYWYCYILL